ncbi:hypothetical protein RV11_GL001400 [Enterococcus phoeniculicola]|jgi:hypothetical protein|uniref:Uncharacterized protein n=1 Tax=Enterococcus phoeniculicola ATCC BAA-412 TaxID=1158610 RepID=R3TK62_9ENTE|nr:hypothetical protein [Enterococcus phoeniculicola]EOL41824.1 hypothetical protein UC3_03389 [Enterococcus phoeniculicola ATCC BAA-412]EOT78682.1 hypothetical protein I589_00187 [Enterococcus phoeniculicola ATCC BAA-412]OJG70398.1 hypothetical protein RV11_GL001400 [Enterococcus phoeniculicola]
MGKKKQFYEDYDALFIKPKLTAKKEKPSVISLWKQVNKAPVVSAKQQAQKPSTKNNSAKKRQHQKKKKSWDFLWPAGIFLAIIAFAIYGNSDSSDSSDDYGDDYESEYVDVRPLQEAGIKRTGSIDVSQPLVATLDDKIVYFNKGYKIEIKGDVDVEQQKDELSVLPTNKDYPSTTSIASLTFYSGRDYLRSVSMGMSGNLIVSLSDYIKTSKGDDIFTKAYPQESVEGVQTGYVVKYEKESDYIYLTIQRYFIFSDGTGVWLDTYSTSTKETELKPTDSFKGIKKAYSEDFEFLEENFLLTKDSEEAK